MMSCAHPSIKPSGEEPLGAVAEVSCGRQASLVPVLNPLNSPQMRLLLVKQGSGLPLYLHLATDYLRLFTLYEQVGRSSSTKC